MILPSPVYTPRSGRSQRRRLVRQDTILNAVVVGAPVDDALLDGLRFEVLSQGFADEGREFRVGGEAERDELFDGELVDVGAVFGGEESGETESLLEADDAVLNFGGAAASDASHDEEDDSHCDPPETESPMCRPVVDCDVDGEDEVEQKHGQHKEMKQRVEAFVVFDVLWSGHSRPLGIGVGGGPQHTIWGRLERWQMR
jgi:hypothetical protein